MEVLTEVSRVRKVCKHSEGIGLEAWDGRM